MGREALSLNLPSLVILSDKWIFLVRYKKEVKTCSATLTALDVEVIASAILFLFKRQNYLGVSYTIFLQLEI